MGAARGHGPAVARTTAVILAAGEARRFGAPKLLAPLEGRPLLQHVIDAANASACDDVIVVVGHGAPEVLAKVRLGRAVAALNSAYANGQSTSLRAGLRRARGSDAAVVLLGDQPRVTARLIDALLDRQRDTGASAVICARDGHRSPPTLLRRDLWPAIDALTGDVGARELLRDRDDVAVVEVTPDLGGLDDVDRPSDLDALGA
ncbi:MAG TPA: nucleotidyltransferase family protein [Candidatus Limnocylindria bacterium]|nr:nucleotidyltransferase family protein [Candidatus Limnocylindria bacterium]